MTRIYVHATDLFVSRFLSNLCKCHVSTWVWAPGDGVTSSPYTLYEDLYEFLFKFVLLDLRFLVTQCEIRMRCSGCATGGGACRCSCGASALPCGTI